MFRVAKQNGQETWEVVMEIQDRSVPDVDLTPGALEHWQQQKAKYIFGYVSFDGLQRQDILSILSASKQGNARLGKNQFGHVSSYKLLAA